MGGGLMQLVAYGAQDIYLTGNPQITFFKVVYRRHTNFSMEAIEQTFTGAAAFGSSVTATISRNGDLVSRLYIEHTITGSEAADWASNYGHALIKESEIEIGGQRIDKHTGMWLTVYSELTEPNFTGERGVEGDNSFGTKSSTAGSAATLYQKLSGTGLGKDNATLTASRMFIPLRFWFCRNPGLALPLIALQYHEVKVKITFETQAKLTDDSGPTGADFKLWADYIYLDTDERRRFAQVSHEYLIEQVQIDSNSITEGSATKINLNFNHPVKELIWVFTEESTHALDIAKGAANEGPESTIASPCTLDAGAFQLKLNGHDRFAERSFEYFTRTQVWQHHTGYGGVTSADSICVYSFALKPEEHQPSGTCNFSRIDNAQLNITTGAANGGSDTTQPGGNQALDTIRIFAVNYNVLRIMSGMGGLAYSN